MGEGEYEIGESNLTETRGARGGRQKERARDFKIYIHTAYFLYSLNNITVVY